MPIGSQLLHDFLLLFGMVNVVGNLPVFAELTQDLSPQLRRKAFRTATITGGLIVLGFAFLGDVMLRAVFQVDTDSFKIAGGLLVFAVAARAVLLGPTRDLKPEYYGHDVAVFPMGFPFLAGPGTIVTTILLIQAEGHWLTVTAAVLVYAAVFPVMHLAPFIERTIGRVAVLVLTRILYIFICAKATAFVLNGIKAFYQH